MRILAIDSSAMVATVAVTTDGVLNAEYTINHKKTHSQTLLPMIDEMCKTIELDMKTVDAIAISGGPGSYTGLRIGSATAKGFGLALGIPIINVPTMDALAYNMFSSQYIVCPIMDARRGQVYTGIYQFEGTEMQTIKEQCIMMLEDLIEELDKDIHDVVIVNFANCDMVGHTGIIPAAIKAVSVVDECVGEVYNKVLELGGTMLITADHGNSEMLLDEDNNPFTAHTTNEVPLIVTNSHLELKEGGKLGDLAPTILQLLGLHEITYDELENKLSSDDTFVLYIGRPDCGDCKEFHPILTSYLEENKGTYLYYLNIQAFRDAAMQEGASEKEIDFYKNIRE